ncbi:MAG: calcium/sodium antiporter [Gemmatimonadota bacterium]
MGIMAVCFLVLAKCADWLVEGAIDIARLLHVSDILIGIVIVSVGTTAPELAVSVQAALAGEADISLGNAVGSVIYDDGVALPLVALLSPVAVSIDRTVLRSASIFLVGVHLIAYGLAFDGALDRHEGVVLVLGFLFYLGYNYWEQRRHRQLRPGGPDRDDQPGGSRLRVAGLFAAGLGGVLASSHGIVLATPVVAGALGVSKAIIALALVALGTSIPEIATCVAAARRGHGSLAVGNILGADILNICWIAGASAMVSGLHVAPRVIHFMFPSMLAIVFAMLALLRLNHTFTRWKGAVMLGLFGVYALLLVLLNPGRLPAVP